MPTHLRNAVLVDPANGVADQPSDLTVQDGSIVAVGHVGRHGGEDRVVDLEGRFVTPGLVNAHDHLYSHELRHPYPGWGLAEMRSWLDARDISQTFATMLRSALLGLAQGITTVRDLGANHGLNVAFTRSVTSTGLLAPRVVPAGRPIVMTGGHVHAFGREADGPWECRRAVREQLKSGAEVIKIMASGGLSHYPDEDFGLPQFTDTELQAIVDEARAGNVPTCAHAFGRDAVHRAVACGVDSVEHGVDLADETIELMTAGDIAYVPTLANMRRIASPEFNANAGHPERAQVLEEGIVRPHGDSFRRAVEAGVRIGVGTDSTGTYGEELAAMHQLGMDPLEVLRAATTVGAGICRQASGLSAGMPADLAIHDRDPLAEPHRLAEPSMVCVGGRLFDTGDLVSIAGGAARPYPSGGLAASCRANAGV